MPHTYPIPISTQSKFLTHVFLAIELDPKTDYLQARQWSRVYKVVRCPCLLLYPTGDLSGELDLWPGLSLRRPLRRLLQDYLEINVSLIALMAASGFM